jgi:transcriptional regulator with XRE-family HTH domain
MNLGSYIKKYRKQRQMTQTYLAKIMDVSSSAISLWEASEGTPTKENLKRLSIALEVDYHKLVNYYNEYKKAFKEQKKIKFAQEQKNLTFVVPPSPTGVITVSVGGSGGSGGSGNAQAMTQDGVALTSMEHPQIHPEPVAWVDEIWLLRPDLTEKLPYEDIFSRSKDENYVPLFERSQIGYTQEQVMRMIDMSAKQNREWVSLTNDDISAAYNENYSKSFDYMPYDIFISFYQALEKYIKEKNGY